MNALIHQKIARDRRDRGRNDERTRNSCFAHCAQVGDRSHPGAVQYSNGVYFSNRDREKQENNSKFPENTPHRPNMQKFDRSTLPSRFPSTLQRWAASKGIDYNSYLNFLSDDDEEEDVEEVCRDPYEIKEIDLPMQFYIPSTDRRRKRKPVKQAMCNFEMMKPQFNNESVFQARHQPACMTNVQPAALPPVFVNIKPPLVPQHVCVHEPSKPSPKVYVNVEQPAGFCHYQTPCIEQHVHPLDQNGRCYQVYENNINPTQCCLPYIYPVYQAPEVPRTSTNAPTAPVAGSKIPNDDSRGLYAREYQLAPKNYNQDHPIVYDPVDTIPLPQYPPTSVENPELHRPPMSNEHRPPMSNERVPLLEAEPMQQQSNHVSAPSNYNCNPNMQCSMCDSDIPHGQQDHAVQNVDVTPSINELQANLFKPARVLPWNFNGMVPIQHLQNGYCGHNRQ